MHKTAEVVGAVYTQAYLEDKKIRAYKVCFNNNAYRTDQLII